MNEEEKRKYEAFQYWIQTNTERGVTTIPDNLCLFVVNLIKNLQKENEELKNKNKTLEELLQGTLYEMYKYYRDLANSYQANCILKEKVKDKIEELEKDEYSKYYYMFLEERDLKYTIQILQELLEESEDSKDGEG